MITKITDEQQKLFESTIQQYLTNITDFPPLNIEEATKNIDEMYKSMGYKKPIIIVAKNPYEIAIMAVILKHNGQLDSQLHSQLYSQLSSQLKLQLNSINNEWYVSTWWRYWDCYYQFCKKIGVGFNEEKLSLFHNFLRDIYFCIPYKGICFISEPPIKAHYKDKKLHNDGGASIEFKSSLDVPTFGVWSLNGVQVPQYLAETPASNLDIEFFKKEKNADVKAEFIRKYGIERMISLGKLVDTWENHEGTKNFEMYKASEYKIVDMSPIFTTYKYLPYMYMKNLTVKGIYHLECVYDPINKIQPKTILEGLKVRMGGIDPETVEIISIK